MFKFVKGLKCYRRIHGKPSNVFHACRSNLRPLKHIRSCTTQYRHALTSRFSRRFSRKTFYLFNIISILHSGPLPLVESKKSDVVRASSSKRTVPCSSVYDQGGRVRRRSGAGRRSGHLFVPHSPRKPSNRDKTLNPLLPASLLSTDRGETICITPCHCKQIYSRLLVQLIVMLRTHPFLSGPCISPASSGEPHKAISHCTVPSILFARPLLCLV